MTAFPLRIPDHVMSQARTAADEEKVSINQLLLSFIAEGIGHRRALQSMRERAKRGNVEAALAVLDMVPDVAPDEGDEMPEPSDNQGPAFGR